MNAETEIVIEAVPVEAVRLDGGTQPRAQLNEEAVAEYAEAIAAGQVLPPIIVFFDGSVFWLADGFHRYHAYARAGVLDLPADIRVGTLRDAILFSVRANADHGLRRTNEDKRRAVMTLLQDEEWGAWSDNAVAKACAVSRSMVESVRKSSLAENEVSAPAERTYTTKHGTQATMKVANIGRAAPAKPSAPPAHSYSEPEVEPESYGPSEDELAADLAAEQADQARILAILNADDPLAEAVKSNQALARQLRAAEDLLAGVRNDNSILTRQVKALRAKLDQLGQPA